METTKIGGRYGLCKTDVAVEGTFHHQANVKIRRSKRKTLSIELKEDYILVKAPLRMSSKEIVEVLEKKRAWIEKHQKIMEERKLLAVELKPYTEEQIKELYQKAKDIIPEKVHFYASKMGVTYGRITIRCQRTRWGSCSGEGNLNFNCLLVDFPEDVLDSIVVHELAHRKHMNHSKEFYAEVEKYYPKYRACRKWLKANGAVYMERLP